MVILENPRPLCDDLIQRVVEKYIEERHYKVPKPGRLPSSKSSCTNSTQTHNAPTETINESSSEATNSNVLEIVQALRGGMVTIVRTLYTSVFYNP